MPVGATSASLADFTGAESVLVQSDGKLLVTGTVVANEAGGEAIERYFAVRFDTDGSDDTSYNQNAAATFQFQKADATQEDILISAALGH